MEAFWNDLRQKIHAGTATKNETQLYKKIGKTLKQISMDPTYPGLETHNIEPLTKRYGQKVWQSYIENHTPGAGRIYWVYGPDKVLHTGQNLMRKSTIGRVILMTM